MGVAITSGDAGDHLAIERVALVGPVDGDPERLAALLQDHAAAVGHFGRLLLPFPVNICGRMASDCKGDLARNCGLPDPDLVVVERSAADRRYRLRPCERV